MTREEWLIHAVEKINDYVFSGALNLENHKYQIACGRCLGSKQTECIQPYDGEDVSLDDFFPTTISVNFTMKDTYEMLLALTHECIHAFFNIKGNGKDFKRLAVKYGFDKPCKVENANDYLRDTLKTVLSKIETERGKFPGEAVVFHKKEKKETKKSVLDCFCPECGYVLKMPRKTYESFKGALPTCPCGTKMGIDFGESPEEALQ